MPSPPLHTTIPSPNSSSITASSQPSSPAPTPPCALIPQAPTSSHPMTTHTKDNTRRLKPFPESPLLKTLLNLLVSPKQTKTLNGDVSWP
jgi:hypothetical protein